MQEQVLVSNATSEDSPSPSQLGSISMNIGYFTLLTLGTFTIAVGANDARTRPTPAPKPIVQQPNPAKPTTRVPPVVELKPQAIPDEAMHKHVHGLLLPFRQETVERQKAVEAKLAEVIRSLDVLKGQPMQPVPMQPLPGPPGPSGKDGLDGKDGLPGPAGKDAQPIDVTALAEAIARMVKQQPQQPPIVNVPPPVINVPLPQGIDVDKLRAAILNDVLKALPPTPAYFTIERVPK
jgi:hypothetical protein